MRLILLLLFTACTLTTYSQKKSTPKKAEAEFNLKEYWLVILKSGPTRNQDTVTAAEIQKAHMANINRLYYEGKLKVAGPFGEDGDWQGLFIFDCKSKEEVEQLLKTDKAVASGRLVYEIHSWYTEPSGSFKPGKPKKP
jgi:uncharacterized protein YciI